MSAINRGSVTPNDDNLTWWQIFQNLLAGRDWDDSGGSLRLTPEDYQRMYMDDLNDSSSASWESSALAQKYGQDDVLFYRVDDNGNLVKVDNSRIQIIVRKYNDNQVGVLFRDQTSGNIVQPRGLQLGENITPSDRQIGEYTVAPPKTNLRPGDLAYTRNFNAFNVIQYFENNTTIDTTPPPDEPTPDEPTIQTIDFNRDNYNIQFRIMEGNRSNFYEGPVFIQETIYDDGSTGFNFINADGVVLSSNLPMSGPNTLWDGGKGQFVLQPGGGSVIDYLNTYYGKQPEPEPEPPAPSAEQYDADSEEYNLLFTKADGSRYRGQINIIYQFEAGEWKFRAVQAGTNEPLTIKGNNVNEIGRTDDGPLYSLPYEDGVDFGASFDSTFEGIPPEPAPDPRPRPDPPTPPTPVGLTTDRQVGRIYTGDHLGVGFFDSTGKKIEDDDIVMFTKGDVDGDGKNEIYFTTVRGEPVSIDKVNGYDYENFPEADTTGTGRRRLPAGDVVLYDIDAGIDNLGDLFENGFGARERETIEELNLLESLPIKGFVLYNRTGPGPKIENKDNRMEHLWITGIIKHDINGNPQFFDLSDLEKKNDIDGNGEGDEGFNGTFESRGGEPAPDRFDLYSPPDLCGGTGPGRRLMACGPDEPAPEYNERKNEISEMELLNFERNRMEEDERDVPDYAKTQFERMRNTTDERELVSMYGTFSSASYIPEDKRPKSLFGLDYDEKHSTHNMATYVGRAGKNGIISIRGTKVGNVVDLASDALILSDYEESLSIRFEQSLKEVQRIMDAHPRTQFTLSSHSLGGTINEYIINELKGTEYEKRVKAISFNPGKAPNVKTERAQKVGDLITDASVARAFAEQDPRFLPIMGSIQRDLGISTEMLTNPEIMTNEAEMERIIQNYPELTRSFNGLMERLGGIGTLEGRTAEAESWIAENEALLGSINYTASLGNIIKTKIMFDLMLKLFDFSANYTIDQFLERESEMDRKMGKAVRPFDVLWSEGNNVVFKYKNDPISLHHSFFEDERQNVRTYKGKEVSVLREGIVGKLGQGLQEHGMKNFLTDDHQKLLDHSETWSEYFSDLLNDNVDSFSETLNGLRTKLDEKSKEYIRENGWADFLGLL